MDNDNQEDGDMHLKIIILLGFLLILVSFVTFLLDLIPVLSGIFSRLF